MRAQLIVYFCVFHVCWMLIAHCALAGSYYAKNRNQIDWDQVFSSCYKQLMWNDLSFWLHTFWCVWDFFSLGLHWKDKLPQYSHWQFCHIWSSSSCIQCSMFRLSISQFKCRMWRDMIHGANQTLDCIVSDGNVVAAAAVVVVFLSATVLIHRLSRIWNALNVVKRM